MWVNPRKFYESAERFRWKVNNARYVRLLQEVKERVVECIRDVKIHINQMASEIIPSYETKR
jgi:hypothetical protein